jgi:predicted nucleotidyltransferase
MDTGLSHAKVAYPSPEHERAAEAATEFFAGRPEAGALLFVGSCARGKASPDSCLDLGLLLSPGLTSAARASLARAWDLHRETAPAFEALRRVGRYSNVEVDFHDGRFKPQARSWTSGPDPFELEIGNLLVYAAPLWEAEDHWRRLRVKWLPYYSEDLRQRRLTEAKRYCLNNLDHIPLYVKRGLYFQSLSRLWQAFQEFMQALFIARRIYPIAYDKWIREQVVDILGLPELYPQLTRLFEIGQLESRELAGKAQDLGELLDDLVV